MNKFLPLVIDLDGSLTYVDTLHESTLKLLSKHPIDVFRLPLWLYQGKATLKKKIAQKIELNPEAVPYNQELLEYLKEQKFKQKELEKIKKFEELENQSKNINFDFKDFDVDKSTKN